MHASGLGASLSAPAEAGMDELSREANAIPTVRCEQQRRAVFIHDKTTVHSSQCANIGRKLTSQIDRAPKP